MTNKIQTFLQPYLKKELSEIRPGFTVRVYQKIKEAEKERLQSFEGLVIARKHGRGINATITVRKISGGIGVERIFPIHSPNIEKIEVVKKAKVRRAKLYYMRKRVGKATRISKGIEVSGAEENAKTEETKPVEEIKPGDEKQ